MSQSLKLSPEMQRFAEEQVSAGNFENVDAVARAAFALLRENAKRRDAVREELGALFAEMDGGKAVSTSEEDFARMVHEAAAEYCGK